MNARAWFYSTSFHSSLDQFVDHVVRQVDEAQAMKLRRHCQHADCFNFADVSDIKTSLSYCRSCWAKRQSGTWNDAQRLEYLHGGCRG